MKAKENKFLISYKWKERKIVSTEEDIDRL